MKIKNTLIITLTGLLLISCGPIVGQVMRVGEGVKSFEVKSGNIADLRSVERLLVYGPFEKREKGRYICRGEDAASFSEEFNSLGLFSSEVYIERNSTKVDSNRAAFKEKSADTIKSDLRLANAPDTILFGAILLKNVNIAPTRGAIMDASFSLEFFNIASKKSTVIEVHVKKLSKEVIKTIGTEIQNNM